MRKGIVIGTSEATRPFYLDLMATIKTDYPIYLCWEGLGRPEGSFELGAIAKGAKMFDEFIYLHDTILIKDNAIFDILFSTPFTTALSDMFFHYMGKYISKDLPAIPIVKDKEDAIYQEGKWFGNEFRYAVMQPVLPISSNDYVERHGRKNMMLENQYLIKFKGTWR